MFGRVYSGNHRTGKHHHHAGKLCLTLAATTIGLLNAFQICTLCCVVYVYFHTQKKKGILCCVERRSVKECWLLCVMMIEKMKREFGFFIIIMEYKIAEM